jgi:RimJ/RimL family protein N-acetyltransferase
MTASGDDTAFSQQTTLRDGTPVTIRVMRPDDRDRLVAAFGKLDADSIYTRFFSFRKELPESAFKRIAEIDFVRLAGLVVTIGTGADETIIGAAHYVATTRPDAPKTAEVAFTVEEDYQGQGLAGKLLSTLVDIARQHGIDRFEADVLAGNASMLKVFERSGLPLTKARDGGVIHLEMALCQDGDKT